MLFPQAQFDLLSVLLMSSMWILPGMSLASSLSELARRNMSIGSSRLFYAFMVAILVSYAIQIGFFIIGAFKSDFPPEITGSVDWGLPMLSFWFLLTSLSFCVLIHTPVNLWFPVISASCIAFVTYRTLIMSSTYTNFATLGAALLGGLWSRLWSAATGKTLLIPLTGAIILLVPGSLSVRSFLSMFSDKEMGPDIASQMIQTSVSLAIGVVISTSK
ncbi:hypothetical protein GEMRC1_007086 [Eukaryota sp. GEM-RC1]